MPDVFCAFDAAIANIDDNWRPTVPWREQLDWLKRGLKHSKAQWKVIAADMPIGLGVPDGEVSPGVARWEAVANGDPGPAQGRTGRQLACCGCSTCAMRFDRGRGHCAAHYAHPDRAAFQDFEPFWSLSPGR